MYVQVLAIPIYTYVRTMYMHHISICTILQMIRFNSTYIELWLLMLQLVLYHPVTFLVLNLQKIKAI